MSLTLSTLASTAGQNVFFHPVAHSTKLSPVHSIELDRIEGVRAYWNACTFSGANNVLSDWATTAPKGGGYDKVAVTITWANGLQHQYRLDLQHPDVGACADVAADLKHFVSFVLGESPRDDWTAEQYASILQRYETQGVASHVRNLRAQCMFSDF